MHSLGRSYEDLSYTERLSIVVFEETCGKIVAFDILLLPLFDRLLRPPSGYYILHEAWDLISCVLILLAISGRTTLRSVDLHPTCDRYDPAICFSATSRRVSVRSRPGDSSALSTVRTDCGSWYGVLQVSDTISADTYGSVREVMRRLSTSALGENCGEPL